MAIKKFKIEASEQAKQLAKKPVKASDGEWDKAVVSFIDSIPTLPEQGKVISKKYKGFPVVIVGLGDGKCLYNGYTRTNDAASDVQFIRGLIKRGNSPEKATANMGYKTYTRGEVEGACGGKKSVKSAAGKKRWGLYSDFGQKILNETFDSKREAQKAFREYGYTKDSEAWIEEVDETAVGKFDKKPANSACGGKKSVKGGRDKLKARKDWAVDVASRYSLFNGKNGDIENSNNKAELIRKCKAMSDPAWVEDNMLSGIIYNNDAQSDVDNADNPNYKPKKKSVKSSTRKSVHKTIKATDEWGYDFDDFDDLPDDEEDTTSSPFGLPDDYAKKWAKHGDKGPTAYFQIKVDTKRKLDEIDKMIDQVDGLDWITSWYDGLEGPDPGERYFILEYTPYTTKEALQKLYDIAEQFGGTAKNITVDGVQPIKSSNVFSGRGSEGRKWVNTELTKDEWAKLRGYLKSKGYKFEPSAAGDLIHVECFLNDKEVAQVDAFIDTLDDINSAEKAVKCSKRSRSVKAASADGYDFAFYRDGYRVLTKTENNRGKWLAQKDDEEPFEITYEQARGFEPIDPRNRALQLKVGKALKFPIKSATEDSESELNKVYQVLIEMEGTWKNPETGWTGKCEIYQRDLDDGSYVFSLVFGNNTSEPDDILYVPSKHKFTIYPNSGMPRFANSLEEFKRNLKAEYSYLTKIKDTTATVKASAAAKRRASKSTIKCAYTASDFDKIGFKFEFDGNSYTTTDFPTNSGKFHAIRDDNGKEYPMYIMDIIKPERSFPPRYTAKSHTYEQYGDFEDYDPNQYDIEESVSKASAAAKRRAKQRVAASVNTEDIVMYWDGQKVYEGPVDSDMTRKVKWFLDEPEKLQQVVDYCNSFGDPVIEDTSDTMDVAATFVEMVDYELREADSIDDDVYISDEKGNFEIFRKSDEVTGAKKSVKCAVNSSRYYQITDHNNDEVGRSDIEDEARELAKKLLRENNEDHYDLWWVDTDPDSTDEDVFIDTIYADKPFSVEGYYETNFRGLSDSDTFYELRDALEYAQELLGKGLSVRLECENAGGRVEITPDEYDEFMATDPEYFEDLPKLAEWISDVQVERMDSRQEPWLDNWQYNTDIGMSTNAGRKFVKADFNDIEDIEDFYDGENFDNTKALGAFNSDTAPYDVNTTVAEYITDNYGIYAESVSYVEYNGPGDWVVDMSQSGQAVADDFVYFLSEKDYDLSLKLYGESETDASGYDMAKYYGDSAIHGNDFQFQFYPAQNQWSAPQVDVDINELIQIGLTQKEANRVVDLVAEYEQNYISICQDINYYIENFLKELSEEEVKASTGVKAALGNKNKTDYASNPIYELDKYVKDLAEGVAAAAGITLTYQVSDEAITFIEGDGTAVFIQPISEITPEPDDLENDIQELVSAIQYSDMDNSEYWPEDTAENDPDYATRAVQMSVDDDLEPVMGEGEDVGFGIDSNGETIDESTVSELYRIAEKEILPNTELAQLDPYVSIDEDSWDFYFGGISNNGMMGVVKFYFHFKLTSDNIDLNEYVLPDAKLYPDFNYYKASLDFDIYTENGKVTDVVLESADIYKTDNSYDSHFSGKFGEAFNTEALENYIEKLAAPAAEEIYNAVSNL